MGQNPPEIKLWVVLVAQGCLRVYHKLGELENRKFYSYSSGNQSKIKVVA